MIELKNISRLYETGKVSVAALDNVSLRIEEGEFVAIMGPSGSGKSTLLNILGFLDKPDRGSYLLFGRDISRLDDDSLSTLRNHVAGFVFQQFHLLPRLSALQNAELPLIYAGKRELRAAARARLGDVGLGGRVEHRPGELSGGEQQRVAIARSLVNDPRVIFADEPTGNLDTKSAKEIMAILQEQNLRGKTIVMVTHENEVAAHARRIIRMRDGVVVSDERSKPRGRAQAPAPPALRERAFESGRSGVDRAQYADYFRQALGSILTHKLRSLLSITGILIGVAAVISMMALGEGAKASISERLSSLGTNVLTVMPGARRAGGVAVQTGAITRLTLGDAEGLSRIAAVSAVSPSVRSRVQLVHGNKNWNSLVEGVGPSYASIRSATPVTGRFFTPEEFRMRSKVALAGATVVRELFGATSPVGRSIKINRINFTVIGVLPAKGMSFRSDQDDVVVVPVTTAMYRLLGKTYVDTIDIQAASQERIDEAKKSARLLLNKRYRLAPDNEESFEIMDLSEIREALSSTTRTMSLLLGIVAAISLLVGGIGIMNIMLVSVKERVKEIGLRKAIGARRKDIRLQFLIESGMLTVTGGLAGILLGTGITIFITVFAGWSVKISIFSIVLSTAVSIIIGIAFGFWPAVQASRLNPIEALRYE